MQIFWVVLLNKLHWRPLELTSLEAAVFLCSLYFLIALFISFFSRTRKRKIYLGIFGFFFFLWGLWALLIAGGVFQASHTTELGPGKIKVLKTRIFPEEESVIIHPGTTFEIAPGQSLLFYGKVSAKGTQEKPIQFLPSDTSQGMGVVALFGTSTSTSTFIYCRFKGGKRIALKGRVYTGTFSAHYTSDLSLKHCLIEKSLCGDGANFRHCKNIAIRESLFLKNAGDGIDFDSSTGEISSCLLIKNGDDGIDGGKSEIKASNNLIIDSADKGISLGEKSRASLFNNAVLNNSRGLEIKGASKVLLLNNLLAFNKNITTLREKSRVTFYNCLFYGNLKNTIEHTENVLLKKENSLLINEPFPSEKLSDEIIFEKLKTLDFIKTAGERSWLSKINGITIPKKTKIPAGLLAPLKKTSRMGWEFVLKKYQY